MVEWAEMREALKDYFSSGSWKEFVEDVSRFLDASLCYLIVDFDENLWTQEKENPICTQTKAIKAGKVLCLKDRDKILLATRKSHKTQYQYCHMNFMRFNIPILFPDDNMVYFGMCGIKCHPTMPAETVDHAEMLGWDPEELQKLYRSMPIIRKEKVEEFTRVLEHLLSKITELVSLKEALKTLLHEREETGRRETVPEA